MPLKTIKTDKAPEAIGPYSQAVRMGHLLFCSGQIPLDPVTGQEFWSFPLPAGSGHVHVIGRVVRTVPSPHAAVADDVVYPGMGIEFEQFGSEDRHAIESFLFANERLTARPETGDFSFPGEV